MIKNADFDCGLKLIGHFDSYYDKNPELTWEQRIDRDIKEIITNNAKVYITTRVLCTLQKVYQEKMWTYLINKHGFKQISDWVPAKSLTKGSRDKVALFEYIPPNPLIKEEINV